jgi:hypothetical protein
MKKIILVIAVTFAAACLFGQKSVKVFDPGKLTTEELQDIKLFNDKKGQPRWEEFQKIKHIFPTFEATVDSSRKKLSYKEETVSLIMTKDQLEKLIGKPDFENGSYELGKKRFDCEVSFPCNKKNEILDFVYANCSGQLKKK